MRLFSMRSSWSPWILLAAFVVTSAVYLPGLYGGFLFDDYPNIVDNHGVQPTEASVPALVRAALSSPSSEFKRPLASLSFAANYLATGLDPYWMKLTNLLIHLLNGLLVFWLTRSLLRVSRTAARRADQSVRDFLRSGAPATDPPRTTADFGDTRHTTAAPACGLEPPYTDSDDGSTNARTAAPTTARRADQGAPATDPPRTTADFVDTHRTKAAPAYGLEPPYAPEPTYGASPAGAADPPRATRSIGIIAALVAGAWMLLPINLTGVLYVVQRMESMANAFVLLGLIGYVAGRRYMLAPPRASTAPAPATGTDSDSASTAAVMRAAAEPDSAKRRSRRGFILCVASIILPAGFGVLAKETAVMLPLYAVLIEWALFRFRAPTAAAPQPGEAAGGTMPARADRRLMALFTLVLALPIVVGLAWLLPHLLRASAWATRDFTMGTRLLSEARIVVDYVAWTLLPTPDALSFYHDDFHVSTGLLAPWTTLASMALLAALVVFAVWIRKRRPLVALGIVLFLGCQLLTGTILPLELIYEHRNYFASFGLLLALVPLLAAPPDGAHGAPSAAGAHGRPSPAAAAGGDWSDASAMSGDAGYVASQSDPDDSGALPMALPRYVLLGGLLLFWTALTAVTAYAWGNPLRLAEDLAQRAPESPRAQYELGRAYIIYSHYDPASPFTRLAYAPLEKAASLPDASILPEQALIFMNARMHLPLKAAWWDSMVAKLKAHPPGVQDESSLGALTQCARSGSCDLPKDRMMEAFMAALSHPHPGPRLLATYGDYAWNVLEDKALGERMTQEAIKASPSEPAYQITLIRMLAAQGRTAEAQAALKRLATLNIGGRLDDSLADLRALPNMQ